MIAGRGLVVAVWFASALGGCVNAWGGNDCHETGRLEYRQQNLQGICASKEICSVNDVRQGCDRLPCEGNCAGEPDPRCPFLWVPSGDGASFAYPVGQLYGPEHAGWDVVVARVESSELLSGVDLQVSGDSVLLCSERISSGEAPQVVCPLPTPLDWLRFEVVGRHPELEPDVRLKEAEPSLHETSCGG